MQEIHGKRWEMLEIHGKYFYLGLRMLEIHGKCWKSMVNPFIWVYEMLEIHGKSLYLGLRNAGNPR